jgi:secreted trypsin-like serine protease
LFNENTSTTQKYVPLNQGMCGVTSDKYKPKHAIQDGKLAVSYSKLTKRLLSAVTTSIVIFDYENDSMQTAITRIVGGTAANPWSLPWMTMLYLNVQPDGRCGLCGGSLITDRHILTAAHCM